MLAANALTTQRARPEVCDDPQGTLRTQTGVPAIQLYAGGLGQAHYTELFIIYEDKKKGHVSLLV